MGSTQDGDEAPEKDQPSTPKPVVSPVHQPRGHSKKRTKTGCITCRKRRIKCGEERPTCKNCIKSKRDCGGYIQPLTFKQPNGDIRIPGTDPGGPYHGTMGSGVTPNHYHTGYYPNQIPPPPGHSMPSSSSHFYQGPISEPTHHAHGGYIPESSYGYPNHIRTSLHGTEASQMWAWSAYGLPSPGHEPQGRRIYPQPPAYMGRMYNVQPGDRIVQNEQMAFIGLPPSVQPHYPTSRSDLTIIPEAQAQPYNQQMYSQAPIETPSTIRSARQLLSAASVGHERKGYEDWEAVEREESFKRPTLNRGTTMPISTDYVGQRQEFDPEGKESRRYSVHGFVQRPSFDTRLPAPLVKQVAASTAQKPGQLEDEEDDDDPYDIEIEFSELAPTSTEKTQQELNTMMVKYAAEDNGRMRSFMTYLDTPTVLATYKPTHSASPLHDEKVGRIFCHFVSVTGPCLSVYERQAANSPITFSHLTVASSQKMLWTYILPTIAIHHPALLHAMLALSALHIAKIQRTSEDPSLKHFTYAVRRVGKLLGLPKRRHEVATLATILLLGFYEVMSADHSRWNLHLTGAKDLVTEFDFARMARITKRMRNRAKSNFEQRYASSYEEHVQIAGIPETLLNDVDWEIDEDLVSRLTGFHIRYEAQWQPNFPPHGQHEDLSEKDIEEYKVKSDLRWWYCKQDIFQSMVSGDPLLMPFEQWIFCPPRGQIGKMNAAYGTMDHLCLLIGRLTDFGGKDRFRKQKVVAANGGQWRPPPGFFGPGGGPPGPQPSQTAPSQSQAPNQHQFQPHPNPDPIIKTEQGFQALPGKENINSGPRPPGTWSMPPPPPPSGVSFHGMMPLPTEPIPMPSAYEAMDANIRDPAFNKPMPKAEGKHDRDLDSATVDALAEHAAIVDAFDTFAQSLGPDFQSLPADPHLPIPSPFGPAIQFRTYPIACIWAFYYVGRILIHRMHPHMPPAAMISVGVSALQTKDYAQMVGKICAGLYVPQASSVQNGILNPHLGAALMESTFFLLFAAIQYQDAAQRGWTISKLNDIAEMTGWQTSASVAAACEVAWQRMGEAGKGPPYSPTMDRHNKDVRVRSMFGRHSATQTPATGLRGKTREQEEEPAFLSHDRVLIDRNPSTRVHWALGLLSVEEDIAKLSLGKG